MDRQGHDYAAPMGYGQQQHQPNMPPQQPPFTFHPHHQFPPFLPSHPSMQQYPFPRPLQQQQQQPQYPHPHLLHLQHQRPPSSFPPHHLSPSPYHTSYDSAPPPPPTPPPSDPELQKRIDKLVEYSAKNGPEFENIIREKQQDNPDYGFLFGGEGHNYYRYKLWITTRPPGGPFNLPFPPSMPSLHPPNPIMNTSPLHPPNAPAGSSASLMGLPSMHQSPFPPSYDPHHPQHSQIYTGNGQPDYDHSYRNFRIPSKPLPADVEMEFNNVLNNLTGTKESIKGAKMWFMQRSQFMPLLAEALKDKIFSMDDSERQLHIIYLVNDILFDSLQRRIDPRELDNEALSFKPVLGSMLSRVYHNPQNREENKSRLQKIVQFWASKEVYDQDSVHAFEYEMTAPPPSFSGSHRDISNIPADLSATAGLLHQHPANQNTSQWHPNRQSLLSSVPGLDKQIPHIPPMPGQMAPQQFHPTSVPHGGFAGSMSMPSVQPAIPQPLTSTVNVGEKVPPYPLFPPGLIPGMVRKMQIGSGVPYSPLSPLDIPTVIPPPTTTPGEILERVSKFFKEIGEVNPSEGPMKSDSKDDYDEYEREAPVRKGGACIPPPPNLQAGTEFGDGGSSESGRLGLGASGVPRESNQYDDVYSSYRKQRSSNYHTTMSVRSSAR